LEVNLVKDVIAPCATFAVAIAAIVISYTQARTASAKLIFDVFGKRYEVYEATRELIDRVKGQHHAALHPTELRILYLKIGEACFFFDRSTQEFLKEVRVVSERILLTRDRRKILDGRSSDEAEWLALGKELSADDARLSEMYGQLLTTFERTMALTELTETRSWVKSIWHFIETSHV
jgi:hypothetical protein